ncbi:MAG: hypothetical protein ABXS91_08720 [Sulfurimonas sp.]
MSHTRIPIRFKGFDVTAKRMNTGKENMVKAYKSYVETESDCKEAVVALGQLKRGVRRGTFSKDYIINKLEDIEEILKR